MVVKSQKDNVVTQVTNFHITPLFVEFNAPNNLVYCKVIPEKFSNAYAQKKQLESPIDYEHPSEFFDRENFIENVEKQAAFFPGVLLKNNNPSISFIEKEMVYGLPDDVHIVKFDLDGLVKNLDEKKFVVFSCLPYDAEQGRTKSSFVEGRDKLFAVKVMPANFREMEAYLKSSETYVYEYLCPATNEIKWGDLIKDTNKAFDARPETYLSVKKYRIDTVFDKLPAGFKQINN